MYVLHHVPDRASLVVHIVLEELNAPYRLQLVDYEAGDLDSPAYRALQPFGYVPALETPDGPMFETAAILLWLADRHGALAPAANDPDRAAFLSWFTFTNNALHNGAMDLIHPERSGGDTAIRPVAETASRRLRAQLGVLDAMVTAKNPSWLSADRPGILAYYVAMLMRWLVFPHFPEHAIESTDFPALHAILLSMEVQPPAIRAAGAEGMSGTFFSNPKG